MKTIKLLLFLLVFTFNTAKASHYMGGEITWECIPAGQPNAGKFIFTLKFYRECYGSGGNGSPATSFGATEYLKTNYTGVPSMGILVTRISQKDISPKCDASFINISCTGMSNGNANMGAVEEDVYKSQPVMISGVPPTAGWVFYTEACCRNESVNIASASGQGYYLRAIMYPYRNTNLYPCYDNSPTFAEVPRTVISAGYPFTYNHNAFDKDLDALAFEWGQPKAEGNRPIPYVPGYSFTSPLPGPPMDPRNVAATIDPTSGEISFTSFTTGAFVTSTKVSSYRCGIKIAEIWRDMQVVLLAQNSNTKPQVNKPFAGGTSYRDTVYAGEIVNFILTGQDFEYLPNGQPQTMEITASGAEFGMFIPPAPPLTNGTMSRTVGCLNAPCATLTPAPDPSYPFKKRFGISTHFVWETNCNHLATNIGCGVTSNVYTFLIKVQDDYCPAPAINVSNIVIVVLPPPAIESPNPQCIKVDNLGDVTLDWSAIKDTANLFSHFIIYSSPSLTTPFTAVDSLYDVKQTSYTHIGAGAQTKPVYYYIATVSGCPGKETITQTDTFSTIKLSVTSQSQERGLITWNSTSKPLLPTSTGIYKLYREYPLGTWNLITSTTDTSYVDTMFVCNDSINYRVEIADTAIIDTNDIKQTCSSISSVDGTWYYDIIPPSSPMINSVSINQTTGFTEMSWGNGVEGDIEAYIIYMKVNNAMTPIDTVWGKLDTTFIDSINIPCGSGTPYTYAVAAMDSCKNISPYSLAHNVINRLSITADQCADTITISWNPYINMKGGLLNYDIYMSQDGSPFTLLGTALPTDTIFKQAGYTNGSTYCYYVVANGPAIAGYNSTSCKICQLVTKQGLSKFIYIRSASVVPGNGGINIRILVDTSATVEGYKLERSLDGITWNVIATLPSSSNPNINYINTTALVMENPYYYRATPIDYCGNASITSNVAKSVLLKVTPNASLINQLTWNDYLGYGGSTDSYQIYRSIDGNWDQLPIATVPSTQLTYDDNVSDFINSNGNFEYFVTALEGPGNTYGIQDTSRSNSIMSNFDPKLYVPSAFLPSSQNVENKTFYPRGVYINSKNYLFSVYDNWGEKVFETNNVNTGWDGVYKGKPSPEGVYTYSIKFTKSNGKPFENTGTVTLIR